MRQINDVFIAGVGSSALIRRQRAGYSAERH